MIDISESKTSTDKHNLMITEVVKKRMHYSKTIDIVATPRYRRYVSVVSRAHSELNYLYVNENVFFLVTIQDKIQNDQTKDYTLVAES